MVSIEEKVEIMEKDQLSKPDMDSKRVRQLKKVSIHGISRCQVTPLRLLQHAERKRWRLYNKQTALGRVPDEEHTSWLYATLATSTLLDGATRLRLQLKQCRLKKQTSLEFACRCRARGLPLREKNESSVNATARTDNGSANSGLPSSLRGVQERTRPNFSS